MFYKIYDWLWNFNDSALTPEQEIILRKSKRKTIITMAYNKYGYDNLHCCYDLQGC